MSQIKAVIFDMYQTLVQDPRGQWHRSFSSIIQEQQLPVTAEQLWEGWHESEERFRDRRTDPSLPFQTYFEAWTAGFQLAFETLGIPGDADAATRRFFVDLSRREPFPETEPVVKEVQENYRTAVLSNADDGFLRPNLELLDLEFEVVLSSERARSYKPQPELFREALTLLEVQPHEAVYVGDRHYEDVYGARSVGMHAVWMDRGERGLRNDLPAPRHTITSLAALPSILDSIRSSAGP